MSYLFWLNAFIIIRVGIMIYFSDFGIWMAFPRKEFTGADFNSSLKDLGLIPSAALLILPVRTV